MGALEAVWSTGRPGVDADAAALLLRSRYGIDADLRELGSQQDRNYLVSTPDRCWVLKIFHAATPRAQVEDQVAAMAALAGRVAAPAPHPGLDSALVQHWTTASGGTHLVVLLGFVEGRSLVEVDYLPRSAALGLASLAGRVCQALQGLPLGAERTSQWDLRCAVEVVRALADTVPQERRQAVVELAEQAWREVEPLARRLPLQAIHGDLTDDNVVAAPGSLLATGVIDFGDLAHSWRVGELAITLSAVLHHELDDLDVVVDMVQAFDDTLHAALSHDERRALWPLVQLRCAVLVVSGWQQLSIEEDNEYARVRMDHEWACFEAAARIPGVVMANLLLAGSEPLAAAGAGVLLGVRSAHARCPGNVEGDALGTPDQGLRVFSLAADSPALDRGAWTGQDAEAGLLAAAVAGTESVLVVPQGEYRLSRSEPSARPSRVVNYSLAAEIVAGHPFAVVAQVRLVVTAVGGESLTAATGSGEALRLVGVQLPEGRDVGTVVDPGQTLALARVSDGLARVRLTRSDGRLPVPPFCAVELAPGWAPLVRGTNAALGLPEPTTSPPRASARTQQARRERFLPEATERYYDDPPEFVRGWGAHLIDSSARVYLDLVNNVAGVGHSHPALQEAVTTALGRLNTNSRFLYRQLADYCERLLATTWGGAFDSVLLVNSGTEAMDLALRMAKLATGRTQVITHREGYHGWSAATDAITTSAHDNPHAAQNRPGWVSLAASPNPYRGTHRGANAASGYLADVELLLADLQATDRPPAAVVMESILGNAGGVVPPRGYFAGLVDRVHSAAGLAIADEVQVGFGRTGDSFWAAQAEGALPDVLVCAKAMGNGFPIGAVITRSEISDALGREGLFFSTTGGSPAACAAGIAVLEVMEREGLMAHAREIGSYLRQQVLQLAGQHRAIGAVHGRGLYQGVELVTDQETLDPDAAGTALLCEALRHRGIIDQATSERQNVLKVKPPLVLSAADVDWFVDALDDVLSTTTAIGAPLTGERG